MTLALMVGINTLVMLLIKYLNITMTTSFIIDNGITVNLIIDLRHNRDNYYHYPLHL